MRKILKNTLLVAFVSLVLPGVVSAAATGDDANKVCTGAAKGEPCYYNDGGFLFFANGAPIEIKKNDSGNTLITWDEGEKSQVVDSTTSVFGGMHDNTTEEVDTSIIMTDGTVKSIFGGGLHKSKVNTSKVVFNGGTVTSIFGGGSAYHHSDSDIDNNASIENSKSIETATTYVRESEVIVNGGTITGSVRGGGQGYAYTGKARVVINETYTNDIDYLTGGGSNGYTGTADIEVHGGNINVLQSVNRGFMESSTILVDGGTVSNLYASAEGYTSDQNDTEANRNHGVTGKAEVFIKPGATVENVSPGQSGAKGTVNKDVAELTYAEGTITNGLDTFNEPVLTIRLRLFLEGEDEAFFEEDVPVGEMTEEEIAEYKELMKELAESEGYTLAFYEDKDFTKEYDITKGFTEDTDLYVKLVVVEKAEEITPPDTGDINLVLIISMIVLAVAGSIFASRKIAAKVK